MLPGRPPALGNFVPCQTIDSGRRLLPPRNDNPTASRHDMTTIAIIGAGINMGPNAVRVLLRLGIGPALDRVALRPGFGWQRRWRMDAACSVCR